MVNCITCDLMEQREAGNAPLWDDIYRAEYWYVVHSYNTARLGWLVVVSRRHLTAIDEMTEAEAAELGILLRRVSLALREVVGCHKTYVAQFAEALGHSHVHFHVIPRLPDQPTDRIGPSVFRDLGVPEAERVSEAHMNEVAIEVGRLLRGMETPSA